MLHVQSDPISRDPMPAMPQPHSRVPKSILLRFAAIGLWFVMAGCASITEKAGGKLADSLSAGISNARDPATVRDGLPAYLLLIDGFIRGNPDSAGMLLAGARLYSAYAGGFVDDPTRAKNLADLGLDYARRGICVEREDFCAALDGNDFDAFATALAELDEDDLGDLYVLASSQAAWVRADPGDYARLAELPRIEALLSHIVSLDRSHDHGNALGFLGVMNCLRPESLGGRPAQGQAFLTEAFAVSNNRNLMTKVLQAEFCARLLFDQEQHDRLLGEVLAADPVSDDLTLGNVIAQDRARQLLESGKDYF